MNRFAQLLDRLAYEPGRNNKLRLLTAYFKEVEDPDRGYALAALTDALSFKHAKPGLIRDLIAARTDPVLFALSYDYVGDLSETVALMWPRSPSSPSPACGGGPGWGPAASVPAKEPSPGSLRDPTSPASGGGEESPQHLSSPLPPRSGGEGSGVGGASANSLPEKRVNSLAEEQADRPPTPDLESELRSPRTPPLAALAGGGEKKVLGHNNPPPPTLTEVVTTLRTLGKTELPKQLARWLDELDETGRWALLKLVTGAMRIGISARLAKTAAAEFGNKDPHDIELMWPGLAPPYLELFAWLEGRSEKPVNLDPVPFRPVMLAHAIESTDFAGLNAADFIAEWKWDGIRVQAVSGRDARGHILARLYSRSGEDITGSFPDLLPSLHLPGAIDGELLVVRDGRVQSFNVLQQRLNRKVVSPKLTKDYPIHLRAYDLLGEGDSDLRTLPFAERRARLEAFVARLDDARVDLSPTIAFGDWEELTLARKNPASAGAGEDAEAVEGVMLKRRNALYLPGRPKGQWWKWKRDPHLIDAVLMYAQRGHGKRSSYYSDYTFGVWTSGEDGEELVPVGKAYFGFTDEELLQIDRFVRRNTTEKFGPVRHVVHEPDQGLVLEVAFEGLQRSTRHKSGVAMRFPRINRLRWDKPPREADRLETLERMLKAETSFEPAAPGGH
ncbi:MAG TPA: ATP-dependent DNA ligase [Bradyrhizobium sp.]|uniref:ATP-dependent DNA ligase n=1 Tax=Bradyrhizobium sp. TaxID=376 RepID=UPI002C8C0E79|nr:ATP-dependent DNA ligase [Bradyrhizobium sp.]HTB00131.1 ATP-dependent DNA ligase [Bradyrhizobium sp.]